MRLKGKRLVLGLFFLLFFVTIEMVGQVINNSGQFEEGNVEKKSSFNIEEIKVRWKKAALDNCTGVPCVVAPPAPSFTCGTSTITDLDNNVYTTVLIGTQCWTKENLKVTKYNDGTPIPLDATQTSLGDGTSLTWQNWDVGRFTIYDNEPSSGMNALNYGFLYNWFATKGVVTTGSTTYKNLCPTGWHVPTDSEWTILTTFLGGGTIAGGKLKETGILLWNIPNTDADNTSGFTARPGAFRDRDGSFSGIEDFAYFWSATQFDSNDAWYLRLTNSTGNLSSSNLSMSVGASIRCLKD